MIFSFSPELEEENIFRMSANFFPLFFFFIQETKTIISAFQRRKILNLKIISQKRFHFWKPFFQIFFPFKWWGKSKRVKIFEMIF